MERYLPSAKISEDYLASERQNLETITFSLFDNPFEEELRALEKIEDRYEQLKACVHLEDKIRAYGEREELPKETALEFLKVAELAVHDEEAFKRYLDEHNENVVMFFEHARTFFNVFQKSPTEWRRYNFYATKEPSKETVKEIGKIREEFFKKYPQWVQGIVRIEASELQKRKSFVRTVKVVWEQKVSISLFVEYFLRRWLKMAGK